MTMCRTGDELGAGPRPDLGRPRRRRGDLPARQRPAARRGERARGPAYGVVGGPRRPARGPRHRRAAAARQSRPALGRGDRRRRAGRRPARPRRPARALPGRPRDRAARPRRPGRQRPPGRRRGRRGTVEGSLDDEVPVYVELPHVGAPAALAGGGRRGGRGRAAAEVPHRRARGRGLPDRHALAAWIDAALDRETPFKCTAGLHHAVRHTRRDRLRAPRLPQRAGRDPAAPSTAPPRRGRSRCSSDARPGVWSIGRSTTPTSAGAGGGSRRSGPAR